MKQKGIWLRNGWRLHHLNAAELALALLVREKPLTAQQLSAALTEKGTRLDRKQLGKILAKLERAGAVETAAGKYICQNETILHYPTTYSESQLLDIIGMTQNTVNGQAVFSGVPPTESLALVTAVMILVISKGTSAPLRLMIFIALLLFRVYSVNGCLLIQEAPATLIGR